MTWTIKRLEELLKAGKIRGYVDTVKKPVSAALATRKGTQNIHKGDGAKDWINQFLLQWCREHAYILDEEFRFHDDRKWRFDWAIRAVKIAVEYEGLAVHKTHHTSSKGYTANADKYNAAAANGWVVFRVTYLNYSTLPKTFETWEKKHTNGK